MSQDMLLHKQGGSVPRRKVDLLAGICANVYLMK